MEAGTRRVAYYNNIGPGRYVFHVIGCNNNGVWNALGSNVKFTLLPHIWQTWWFKSLVVFASLSVAAAGTRYVTRKRMALKLQRLEHQHAVEKERTRIAQDMHDDLGVRLTEILLFTDRAGGAATNLEQTKSLVAKMGGSVREVVDSLDAIVWAVNPRNDSLDHFVPYVCENVQTLLEPSGLDLTMRVPDEVPPHPLSSEVRHHLYMVIREALNNLIKHAGASTVCFSLDVADGQLAISIEDNGRGFCRETSSAFGNGLKNMEKRMQNIGGSWALQSEPGKGTRIQLQIPLKYF